MNTKTDKKNTNTVVYACKKDKSRSRVNQLYRISKPFLVGEALLFGVLSFIMFMNPVGIISAITIAIGLFLVFFGLYRLSMVLVSGHGFGFGSFDFVLGVVALVLGIIFCVFPNNVVVGLMYVFAALFLLNALRILFFAINMMRAGFGRYRVDIVASLVMVVLAVGLFFLCGRLSAENLSRTVVYCFAVFMLINAVMDIYMFVKLLRLHRAVKAIK